MRSDQVFRARRMIGNPYLLCQATSKVTRCLHSLSASTQYAIVDAFIVVSTSPCLSKKVCEKKPVGETPELRRLTIL